MDAFPASELTLAASIRSYRRRQGLTQQELADRLGVPLRSVQDYERGAMPHPKRRRMILAFLAAENEPAAA